MTQNLGFSRFYRGTAQFIYVFIHVYCSTHAPGDLEGTIFLEDQCFPLHPFNIKGGGLVDFDELRAS